MSTDPVQAVREIGREHRPAKVNSVEGTLTCACGHVSAEWDGLELHRAELTVAAARPAIAREANAAGWDEGYGTGYEHADGLYAGPRGPDRHPLNPYRIEREGQA